jgi:hypothetical protein
MRQYRSTSSSSKDTIDEDPWFVSKMNYRNNVKKRLDGLVRAHTITGRLSSKIAALRLTFS